MGDPWKRALWGYIGLNSGVSEDRRRGLAVRVVLVAVLAAGRAGGHEEERKC